MSFGRTLLTSTSPFALQMPDAGGGPAATPPPAAPPPTADPGATPPATPPAAPPAAPGTLAAPPPTPAPATTPPAPPSAAGTLAQVTDTPPVTVPANFPANWRETMAGNDTAYLETLKRFDSPAALARAYKELRTQRDSGQLKVAPTPLAADATPDQVVAWRKEQGLPDTPDAFLSALQLGNGVVPGEADRPLLANFAEMAAKSKNTWTPALYNEAIGWYYGLQEQLIGERHQRDNDNYLETQTELLREWGPQFKAKQNNFNNWVAKTFPEELQGAVLNARMPDGTLMFGHAGVLKAVMEQWEQINPVQSALPNVPGATMANLDSRISEIEQKYMRAPQGSAEWKTYWDKPMQEEYRGLLTARERQQSMRGAA